MSGGYVGQDKRLDGAVGGVGVEALGNGAAIIECVPDSGDTPVLGVPVSAVDRISLRVAGHYTDTRESHPTRKADLQPLANAVSVTAPCSIGYAVNSFLRPVSKNSSTDILAGTGYARS